MSIHFGICSGPVDAFTGLYIDDKKVWEGEATAAEDIGVDLPNLFGGPKQQGGVGGYIRYLPGGPTQVLPDDLAAKFQSDLTGATAPGFRGMSSFVLTGSQGSAYQAALIGLGLTPLPVVSSGAAGWKWSSNNPVIAQNVDARVRRIPQGLDPTTAAIATIPDTGYTAGIGSSIADATSHLAASINASSQFFTATAGSNTVVITAKRNDSTYTGSVECPNQPHGGNNFDISFFAMQGSSYQATVTFHYLPDTGNTLTIGGEVYTFSSSSGSDANPAHIIYDILTNTDWGMGYTSDLIDVAAFNYAASVLFAEGLGLSLMWTQQATIEDFVNEILNHIVGTIFVRPDTGLLTLKLIRGDYDVTTLPVFTPDNADMTNLQRKLWGETINEIVVTWTNPANEQSETVTYQDLSNIAIQGGVVSDSRNFYGVRNAKLAAKLAERELRSVSAPLFSMELRCDREAWDVTPGDCIIVNWPEEQVSNAVMRVGTIDYGTIDNSQITVNLTLDIFSLERRHIQPAPPSGWVDPGVPPAPLTVQQVSTLPAYFAFSSSLQSVPVALTYPEVLGMVFAYSPSKDVSGYDLYSDTVLSTGAATFASVGTKSIVEHSTIATAFVAEAVSTFPNTIVANQERGPQVGNFVFIGGGDTAQEIALVTGTNGTTWTIQRGVLDTIPQAWPVGTPLWYVNPGVRIVEDKIVRSAGETVQYKLATRTSQGVLDISAAPEIDTTLTARPHMPLRPANVKINGVGFGPVAIGSNANIDITWSTRNRTLEDGQVVTWTDGPIAPEYGQQTVVTVYDPSNNIVYQQGTLWTEDELSLPASYFARYPSVTIVVSSLMNGLPSLQAYALQVTGLPNNPSAPLPPAPPAPEPQPSPVAAPGAGAWDVTGGSLASAGGESIPAIIITGTSDNASAVDLVVRYRLHGATDWTIHPLISLAGFSVAHITGVLGGVAYDVQLAYQLTYGTHGTILSAWLDKGSVTTGGSIAQAVQTIGGRTPEQVISDLEAVVAQAQSLTQAALTAAQGLITERGQLISETYHNGVRVKRMLVNDDRQFTDGDKTLWERTDLIAVLAPNGQSMIMNQDTLMWSPTESLAQHVNAVQTQIGTSIASATTQIETWVNSSSAGALWIDDLEASFGGNFKGSITTTQNIVSGMGATWTLVEDVNGHISGIRAVNTGSLSSMVFVSDEIGFTNGTDVVYPLTIVGGVVRATNFEADRVKAASITADMVEADNLIKSYVGQSPGSYGISGSTPQSLWGMVAYCRGGALDIQAWVNANNYNGGSRGVHYQLLLSWNGGANTMWLDVFGDYALGGVAGDTNSSEYQVRVTGIPQGYIGLTIYAWVPDGNSLTIDHGFLTVNDSGIQRTS